MAKPKKQETANTPETGSDADRVSNLIEIGSSKDGLAEAQKIAAKALKEVGEVFPHNGCAATLSALLQLSGIKIPMILGAGKLAHTIESRGWSRVSGGKQQSGDVGVTFDEGGNPGADHIYLVLRSVDGDEMVIADNQDPAPHSRFASGHGKTPTEYFLRASGVAVEPIRLDADKGPLQSPLFVDNAELQTAAMGLRSPFSRGGPRSPEVGLIQDAIDLVTPKLGLNPISAGPDRGIFGPKTEGRVSDFQRAIGIGVDGQVGRNTLRALDQAVVAVGLGNPPKILPASTGGASANQGPILQIAESSAIASYHWNDRGIAPIGYIKGMALMFGRTYCRLKGANPDSAVVAMARADSNSPQTDAISHYRAQFHAIGMDNPTDGPEALRHLFVLMLGLGMRESSGAYCEGRDTTNSSSNTADSCEAGLFQTSWNANGASPLLMQLFQSYSTSHAANPADGLVDIFKEHVHCSAADWQTIGSGTGADFQRLSKNCPAFATEFAAVALRKIRRHWGPINSHAAEIRPEADAMFRAVQTRIDQGGMCPI